VRQGGTQRRHWGECECTNIEVNSRRVGIRLIPASGVLVRSWLGCRPVNVICIGMAWIRLAAGCEVPNRGLNVRYRKRVPARRAFWSFEIVFRRPRGNQLNFQADSI